MVVKRIKHDILSEKFAESRSFYNDVIGLPGGDGEAWIMFFGTDQREVQLSVMSLDAAAHMHAGVSIEVDDLDRGALMCPRGRGRDRLPADGRGLGLRRFFVRDPNGAIINVTQHDA